jgi:hypothetical protein
MAYYSVRLASGKQMIVEALSVDEAKIIAGQKSGSKDASDEIVEVVYLSILEDEP